MKKVILAVGIIIVVPLGTYFIYWQGWKRGLSDGHYAGHVQGIADVPPPPVQHHYRFERNGAPIRYEKRYELRR